MSYSLRAESVYAGKAKCILSLRLNAGCACEEWGNTGIIVSGFQPEKDILRRFILECRRKTIGV